MYIKKEILEAVDRVFKEELVEDKQYVGTITHKELRQAAELVGKIKQEVYTHGKKQ